MENGFIVLNEDEVLDDLPDENDTEPKNSVSKEIFDWIDTIVIALITKKVDLSLPLYYHVQCLVEQDHLISVVLGFVYICQLLLCNTQQMLFSIHNPCTNWLLD